MNGGALMANPGCNDSSTWTAHPPGRRSLIAEVTAGRTGIDLDASASRHHRLCAAFLVLSKVLAAIDLDLALLLKHPFQERCERRTPHVHFMREVFVFYVVMSDLFFVQYGLEAGDIFACYLVLGADGDGEVA